MHRAAPKRRREPAGGSAHLYERCAGVRGRKSAADLSAALGAGGQDLPTERARRARSGCGWSLRSSGAADGGYFILRDLLSAWPTCRRGRSVAASRRSIELKRFVNRAASATHPPQPPDRIPNPFAGGSATHWRRASRLCHTGSDRSFIIIRVCGSFVLFEPGQATVLDAFKHVAARFAATCTGAWHIRIVVIPTPRGARSPRDRTRFPPISNCRSALECGRRRLKRGLADSNRVDIEGKGRPLPTASNATPGGAGENAASNLHRAQRIVRERIKAQLAFPE